MRFSIQGKARVVSLSWRELGLVAIASRVESLPPMLMVPLSPTNLFSEAADASTIHEGFEQYLVADVDRSLLVSTAVGGEVVLYADGAIPLLSLTSSEFAQTGCTEEIGQSVSMFGLNPS